MKQILILVAAIVFLVVLLFSQNIEKDLNSLIESERAFSKTSETKGLREAFLTFLADDSIVFRPKPVSGKPVYEKVPADSPVLLTWEPEFAEVSIAGDLGYTTGPYALKRNRSDAEPSSFGHYVSIWKRQVDNAWKVALDIGIVHLRPELGAKNVATREMDKTLKEIPPGDVEKEETALIAQDRAFSKASQTKGILNAYLAFSADDIRLYRSNGFPTMGQDALRKGLEAVSGQLTWEPMAAGVSLSGDLGYTYGISELNKSAGENPQMESSSYMRIWRKGTEGKWKVALDIFVRIPPANPGQQER